jgi:acetyltransferase-like isoleucine patch superfamily enzyme
MDSPGRSVASSAKFLGEEKVGTGSVIHDFVTIYPKVLIGKNVEVYEGAVIGRPPNGAGATKRRVTPTLKPTVVSDGAVISANAVVYTDVRIGAETLIGDLASIREQCRIGRRCVIARGVTMNRNTKIGDYTKIMDGTHITANMEVGSHVFIGMLVTTANDNSMGRTEKNAVSMGPIIEDNSRIGSGAVILPGIRVGAGSIVGANAVVTKDIPAGKIAMGVPAKIIRDV